MIIIMIHTIDWERWCCADWQTANLQREISKRSTRNYGSHVMYISRSIFSSSNNISYPTITRPGLVEEICIKFHESIFIPWNQRQITWKEYFLKKKKKKKIFFVKIYFNSLSNYLSTSASNLGLSTTIFLMTKSNHEVILSRGADLRGPSLKGASLTGPRSGCVWLHMVAER